MDRRFKQLGRKSANRRYTRREVEKLLYRSGFAVELVESLPCRGYAEWVACGRPGRVRVDRLNIDGLPPVDAEEFHARGFLIEAKPAPRPDNGFTSIVVVTFNQLEYTRLCVESIRRVTDEPYELVFVDNASSDGTLEYLRAVPDAKVERQPGDLELRQDLSTEERAAERVEQLQYHVHIRSSREPACRDQWRGANDEHL